MTRDSETELVFLILTFTEEGLGLLLGLRMLSLQLIAAQKNCVVLVPSVNTVSLGLDWSVTLRPLRKKWLHESGMAKGLQTSGRLQVYYGVSKLYFQHIYFHIYFQNILTWDEAINKINQSLMLWIVTRRHTPVGHRKQRQMLPKCSKLHITPVSHSLRQAEKIGVVRSDSALQKIVTRGSGAQWKTTTGSMWCIPALKTWPSTSVSCLVTGRD